jgi:hypothetical protein
LLLLTHFTTIISKYGLKISTNKTKTTACKEKDPVRNKIAINSNIIEQTNTSNYPGCSISYWNEKDVTVKVSKYLQITGTINRTLKSCQVQKHTRLENIKHFGITCIIIQMQNFGN